MFAASPPRRSVPLELELLEDRCVLSSAQYISGLYASILHRAPAPAEVANWVSVLNATRSPQQIALAIATSTESRSDIIQTDYKTFLGRQPAPGEIAGWVAHLQMGVPEDQVEAGFLASQEFLGRHGGANASWLAAVYQAVLGRPIDSPGLAAWSRLLQAGTSREAVARAIVDSPEAETRLVTAAYQNLLKRNPDQAGLATWVAKLQGGLTHMQLVAQIASSPEFIQRVAHGTLDVPPLHDPPADPVAGPTFVATAPLAFVPPLPFGSISAIVLNPPTFVSFIPFALTPVAAFVPISAIIFSPPTFISFVPFVSAFVPAPFVSPPGALVFG